MIVGADKCLKEPKTCTLEGGVVGDEAAGTVTINLTRPDAEFFDKLALPHAAILPADSPTEDVGSNPLPGTGAYMISAYDPNKGLTMEGNEWKFTIEWDAIQPQRVRLVQPFTFLQVETACKAEFQAKVYADSFATPLLLQAALNVDVRPKFIQSQVIVEKAQEIKAAEEQEPQLRQRFEPHPVARQARARREADPLHDQPLE